MSGLKHRLLGSVLALTLLFGLAPGASAATSPDEAFSKLQTIFEIIEAYHKDGADLETFLDGAIQGGLDALGDPYTNYFTPDEFADFLDSLEGTLSGIGIYMETKDNYIIVAAPIKGSPAFEAGLKTGDRILEANGTDLVGASTEYAGSIIRGEPGTEVTLKIERPSENRTFEVTIVRAQINIPEVEFEMLENGVGYLALTGFSDSASREFYKAVESLKEQGATSLVLDLRQNPGGYVNSAVDIASAWVPKGEPVLVEVGKDGETVHRSRGNLINLPTAVLVDGGSASAAEILAGAIQDYGAGELVGTQTFGKGTVQQILFMNGGDGMKVTIAEYLTGKRHHVDGIGLTPDYVVEPLSADPMFYTPLELDRLLLANKVGLDVLDLQQRLAFLGFDTELDGVFGPKTQRVVQNFRRRHALTGGAVVDDAFAEVLNAEVARAVAELEETDAQLDKAVELLTAK